jgi:hypothetical protein
LRWPPGADRVIDSGVQYVRIAWTKISNVVAYRLYGRPTGGEGGGFSLGHVLADSLTDSTFVHVVADTTVRFEYVVVGLDSLGEEGPASPPVPVLVGIPPSRVPESGLRLAVWPNPGVNGIHVQLEGLANAVSVRVLDIQSRVVRVLGKTSASRPAWIAVWDALDSEGRRVPNGVYFVIVEGTRVRLSSPVVLVR